MEEMCVFESTQICSIYDPYGMKKYEEVAAEKQSKRYIGLPDAVGCWIDRISICC